MLAAAGYDVVHLRYTKGVLANAPACAAVVLHWKSKWGQRVIQEAKAADLPVLVITSKLADAVKTGEPWADLYLEKPASIEEMAALLIDLSTTKRQHRVSAASVEAGKW
jgi:DNA-binding response OmpR family regulator